MSPLDAQFELRYPGGAVIRAQLRRPAAGFSVTALFGPSGCGKTSVLRALAGLEHPPRGRITFAEDVWLDTQLGIDLSPQRRQVGFLFQEYALFPHLTVERNVGYGLRHLAARARQARVGELLARFGLDDLQGRLPHQISGGQQQRVALARALAHKPRLLLLDEPLAALDGPLREELRRELRSLLVDFDLPVILVTHDRQEALTLADHLLVMNQGTVLQEGPVSEVFTRPATEQVARMVGVETVEPGRIVHCSPGTVTVQVGTARLVAVAGEEAGAEVTVCLRAAEVELTGLDLSSAPQANRLPGSVRAIRADGSIWRVELDCGFRLTSLVAAPAARRLGLEVGQPIVAQIDPAAVHLIPRPSEPG